MTEATKDKVLVRKADADISAATAQGVGSSTPSQAIWAYTSAAATCQWDVYPADTHDYVGSHTMVLPGVAAWCVGPAEGCMHASEVACVLVRSSVSRR